MNRIIFVKIPWNIGTCYGVCDYVSPRTCPIFELCSRANYVPKPHFYETSSGMILEIPYSYWIPKEHLLPKYKKYEN